jgi:hypothetical protein
MFFELRAPSTIAKENNMKEHPTNPNSLSPRQFARRNGIGVTKTYQEIKTGRLVALKCGSRTIITVEEERAWLSRLPKLAGGGHQ